MSAKRLLPRTGPVRLLAASAAIGLIGVLAAGVSGLQGAPEQGTLPWKPAAGTEDQYVGNEACLICHDDQAGPFAENPHAGATARAGLPVGEVSCEACHGTGLQHMDASGDMTLIRRYQAETSPETVTATCLTCHAGGRSHAFAATSQHTAADVTCTSCHSVHNAQAPGLLAEAVPGKCFTCHRGVQATFSSAEGHRMGEGLVTCVDCHNPHGSAESSMLARPMISGELCAACHIDKRGPFVYEHPAAAVEGCVACHTPHGSQNRFMLKSNTTRELCLTCHIAVPTFHDVSDPRYVLCTTCHAAIHGSDTHHLFFRR